MSTHYTYNKMGLIKKKSKANVTTKKNKKHNTKYKSNYTIENSKRNKNYNYNSNISFKEIENLTNKIKTENKNKYFFTAPQKKMPINMLKGIRNKLKTKQKALTASNRESNILYDSSQNKLNMSHFKEKKFKKEYKKGGGEKINGFLFKKGELIVDPSKILNNN